METCGNLYRVVNSHPTNIFLNTFCLHCQLDVMYILHILKDRKKHKMICLDDNGSSFRVHLLCSVRDSYIYDKGHILNYILIWGFSLRSCVWLGKTRTSNEGLF